MRKPPQKNDKSHNECFRIIEELRLQLKRQDKALQEKDQQIELLDHRLAQELRHRYSSRQETLEPDECEQPLFDEAGIPLNDTQEGNASSDDIEVKSHTRKRGKREPLPDNLPRTRVLHELPEEERKCSCGCEMKIIKENVAEQLEIIPAQMYVVVNVTFTYGCCTGKGGVKTSKATPQPIPKSMAGPGLLAHVLVSKFCDHLPLYRQESILKRTGVDITRGTLSNWVLKCGDLVSPLINLLQSDIESYDVSYSDESTLQVLKEKNRTAKQKSFMWGFGGGPPDKFSWVYRYTPTRQSEVPTTFFENFKGYLHVDGYAGYHNLENHSVKLVGCMAHARRKFFEITTTTKKKKGLAHWAVRHFAKLYAIEKEAKEKELTVEDIYTLRQEKSLPLMNELKNLLDEHIQKVAPRSPIGNAIQYMINQWHKLIVYLEDGRLEIDNNCTERIMKPFATGRKNWLFANSERGATAAANIYSLIETCKVHKIEPYAYLRYILKRLPIAMTVEQLDALLPYNCDNDEIRNEWLASINPEGLNN